MDDREKEEERRIREEKLGIINMKLSYLASERRLYYNKLKELEAQIMTLQKAKETLERAVIKIKKIPMRKPRERTTETVLDPTVLTAEEARDILKALGKG